jgi:hypothetical protein
VGRRGKEAVAAAEEADKATRATKPYMKQGTLVSFWTKKEKGAETGVKKEKAAGVEMEMSQEALALEASAVVPLQPQHTRTPHMSSYVSIRADAKRPAETEGHSGGVGAGDDALEARSHGRGVVEGGGGRQGGGGGGENALEARSHGALTDGETSGGHGALTSSEAAGGGGVTSSGPSGGGGEACLEGLAGAGASKKMRHSGAADVSGQASGGGGGAKGIEKFFTKGGGTFLTKAERTRESKACHDKARPLDKFFKPKK